MTSFVAHKKAGGLVFHQIGQGESQSKPGIDGVSAKPCHDLVLRTQGARNGLCPFGLPFKPIHPAEPSPKAHTNFLQGAQENGGLCRLSGLGGFRAFAYPARTGSLVRHV